MSFPMKPWEMNNGFTNGNGPPYVPNVPNTNMLHSSAVPFPSSGGGGIESPVVSSASSAPVMPPRPSQYRPLYSSGSSMYRGGYGGYGNTSLSPYSSLYNSSPYSYNSYGSYGGGYGGYTSPYNSMYNRGMGGYSPYGPEGGLSQLAEQSAGPAFESIQSFVAAFGSISMMLESTFAAVHSSFRAVVGVADHMGRLKQVFSAFAAFRFFKWIFKRFLYLVGLSKVRPEDVETVWRNLNEVSENFPGNPQAPRTSSWPILIFLGFIFAGPYLMWKLMASLNLNSNKESEWATGSGDHFLAEATYDFEGIDERELPLRTGQTIRLAPAKFQPPNVKGWVLASDGVRTGLVPTNHLKVLGKRRPTTSALAKASSGPKEPKSVTFNLPPPSSSGIETLNDGIFESERFDM